VGQYHRSSSCVEILNAEHAKDRLNKNMLSPLANYSGKSTRHETAETAKPWVDTCVVEKISRSLRGKKDGVKIMSHHFLPSYLIRMAKTDVPANGFKVNIFSSSVQLTTNFS
jgi:hypothetical protein